MRSVRASAGTRSTHRPARLEARVRRGRAVRRRVTTRILIGHHRSGAMTPGHAAGANAGRMLPNRSAPGTCADSQGTRTRTD